MTERLIVLAPRRVDPRALRRYLSHRPGLHSRCVDIDTNHDQAQELDQARHDLNESRQRIALLKRQLTQYEEDLEELSQLLAPGAPGMTPEAPRG